MFQRQLVQMQLAKTPLQWLIEFKFQQPVHSTFIPNNSIGTISTNWKKANYKCMVKMLRIIFKVSLSITPYISLSASKCTTELAMILANPDSGITRPMYPPGMNTKETCSSFTSSLWFIPRILTSIKVPSFLPSYLRHPLKLTESSASLFCFPRTLRILDLSITSKDPIVRNVAIHLIDLKKCQLYSYIHSAAKKVQGTAVRSKYITGCRYHKMSLFKEPPNIV